MNPGNLTPRFIVPTVASDGSFIHISETNIPTISFIQVRTQQDHNVDADVVASVRLNSIAELEQLAAAINETLEQHKNREA